jgi:small redox-active disulfide protein 2
MEIKVLGRGCVKCNLTEELIRQVLLEERIDAQVEKVSGYKKIAEYGIFLTPSVLIDGEVKCIGRIPKKEEIRAWVTKYKEGNSITSSP